MLSCFTSPSHSRFLSRYFYIYMPIWNVLLKINTTRFSKLLMLWATSLILQPFHDYYSFDLSFVNNKSLCFKITLQVKLLSSTRSSGVLVGCLGKFLQFSISKPPAIHYCLIPAFYLLNYFHQCVTYLPIMVIPDFCYLFVLVKG